MLIWCVAGDKAQRHRRLAMIETIGASEHPGGLSGLVDETGLVGSTAAQSEDEQDRLWVEFKTTYNKQYANSSREYFR